MSFKYRYTTVYNGGTKYVGFKNYLREWNIKINGTVGDRVCWEFGEFLCLR
jgi:hypothetical protein